MKHYILLFFFTCAIVSISAQDKNAIAKSDSLFARGVELYNFQKYKEAIPLFKESDRIDKTELDSLSNRRDYSAMWLASCYYNLGDTVKAKNISQEYYSVRPIDRRFTIESDSLSNIGVEYYVKGDLNTALQYLEACSKIEEQIMGINHPYHGNTLANIGRIKLRNGNSSGIEDIKRYCEIIKSNYDINSDKYHSSIEELIYCYAAIDDLTGAIAIGKEVIDSYKDTNYNDSFNYLNLLKKVANVYINLEYYNDALDLWYDALILQETLLGKNNIEYIKFMEDIADLNYSIGNYTESIKYYNDSLMLIEKSNSKNYKKYLEISLSLSWVYYITGNYDQALELLNQSLQICNTNCGENALMAAKTHFLFAEVLYQLYNYSDAIEHYAIAKNILDNNPGNIDEFRCNLLYKLAYAYHKLSNNQKAIETITDLLSCCETTGLKSNNSLNYLKCLIALAEFNTNSDNDMAIKVCYEVISLCDNYKVDTREIKAYANSTLSLCYLDKECYDEAIKYGELALNLFEKTIGKRTLPYFNALLNLSRSYIDGNGDIIKSLDLCQQALETCKTIYGPKHVETAGVLNFLAYNYYKLGDYEDAISIGDQVLEIRKNILGVENIRYAEALNNLSLYKAAAGYYEDAIELCKLAVASYKETLGEKSYQIPTAFANISLYYYLLGLYDEAIDFAWKAANNYELITGRKTYSYAKCLLKISRAEYMKNNMQTALTIAEQAKHIIEETVGKNNLAYRICLKTINNYYFSLKLEEDLTQSVVEISGLLKRDVKYIFSNSIKKLRQSFWDMEKEWFDMVTHYAFLYPSETMVSNAYNSVLLSKGLLLSTEMEFSNLIQESKDPESIRMYTDLLSINNKLSNIYNTSFENRHEDIDSLQQIARILEQSLIAKSKDFGDYTRNMAIEWKDVKKQLKAKDIAVEFVSFYVGNDSLMYAAYILTPDMRTPRMIPLFEAKQLAKINPSAYYRTHDLSYLIWGNLSDYLHGVENIYFAPSGELYNIGIESLPAYDGNGLMSDKFNLYRLSSTRELAVVKNKNILNDAALFGGLKYDTNVKVLEDDAVNHPLINQRDFSLFNLADSLNLRSGVTDLPETRIEVESIDKSLEPTPIKSRLFTGLDGTEGAFKELSGKKTSIIHIATHGFYFNESEARRANGLSFMPLSNDNTPRYYEDKAMARSGLLFTGANNALMGKTLPENINDGILTAKEITALDLRGLELIVLSACETGLGEITGDGVFGLQRGFKKAGANSLLMSLWKVDDRATQMLMTKFYEHFLSGKSKLESLILAQKYVREFEEEVDVVDEVNMTASQKRRNQRQGEETETVISEKIKVKPFSDPKYWAAFILLDALD